MGEGGGKTGQTFRATFTVQFASWQQDPFPTKNLQTFCVLIANSHINLSFTFMESVGSTGSQLQLGLVYNVG